MPISIITFAQCALILKQFQITMQKLLTVIHTALLNDGWTNKAAPLFHFQRCSTKHWRTSSLGAFRFAITSTVTRSALISLPHFSLSVVFFCHCVITLASRFHNILILALWTTLAAITEKIFTGRISFTHLHSTCCLTTFATVACCTLIQLPCLTHKVILSWADVSTHPLLFSMIDAH